MFQKSVVAVRLVLPADLGNLQAWLGPSTVKSRPGLVLVYTSFGRSRDGKGALVISFMRPARARLPSGLVERAAEWGRAYFAARPADCSGASTQGAGEVAG